MDIQTQLPERAEMMDAFLSRDASYEGVFVTGVVTTGIFCRITCSARKPNPENVEFFPSAQQALLAGFRPCMRCRPLEPAGERPDWLRPLIRAVDADATRRWTDDDLRELGLEPTRVRRWFKGQHGMTFHAYSRARRLAAAMGRIKDGHEVTRAAFDSGYDSLSGFNEAFRKLAGAPPTVAADAPVVSVARIPTPLGVMVAAADPTRLYLLEFADRRMLATQLKTLARRTGCVFVPGGGPVLDETRRQLDAYFEGRLTDFDIPLRAPGTEFQERVWEALRAIPYGETRSYQDVARALGRESAVRAVARANGTNRLAVVIPCHRVIGADGALRGYGGGVWRKRRLLELERAG